MLDMTQFDDDRLTEDRLLETLTTKAAMIREPHSEYFFAFTSFIIDNLDAV